MAGRTRVGWRCAAAATILGLVSGCGLWPSGPVVGTSSTSATGSGPAPTSVGAAAAALSRLPVAEWERSAPYSRDAFGQRWSDDVDAPGGHNGCDQRSDVIRRDLAAVVVKPGTQGCVPLTGTLLDPYSGASIAFVRGADTSAAVQIDHVVALSNAWRTGAQRLTAQARQDFAGDPLGLLAVAGPVNQAKGDDDAAAWLPPNASYRCAYVARQIAVKTAYGFWVTPAEAAAMETVLATCPGQPLPVGDDIPQPVR
ncbi:HNH endonuclease family protein [Nakamurella deserti]|uniref:HNH endonuclease family protein n=1 Tax=Nakamurella deserti TaxID=2164074 RepID=UPI000DBE12AE|nr:HNH endonuclease family protein [Nakamurella deserti]